MTVVLFQPHNDDATLFASAACVRHDPLVITVLRSRTQRAGADTREAEDACALAELGVTRSEQWPYSDAAPDWAAVENAMRVLDELHQPARVFAPHPEFAANGHAPGDDKPGFGVLHHDIVGDLAARVFAGRVTGYLTYTRHGGRSRHGVLADFDAEWVARKLRALACYRSQIEEPSTRPWFVELLDVREWVAA